MLVDWKWRAPENAGLQTLQHPPLHSAEAGRIEFTLKNERPRRVVELKCAEKRQRYRRCGERGREDLFRCQTVSILTDKREEKRGIRVSVHRSKKST